MRLLLVLSPVFVVLTILTGCPDFGSMPTEPEPTPTAEPDPQLTTDAGHESVDGGSVSDAGNEPDPQPTTDAGNERADAGNEHADAGNQRADSDAGMPVMDGGFADDAGVPPVDGSP